MCEEKKTLSVTGSGNLPVHEFIGFNYFVITMETQGRI